MEITVQTDRNYIGLDIQNSYFRFVLQLRFVSCSCHYCIGVLCWCSRTYSMSVYKQFMRLVEAWPKDTSRKKDLGLFLEKRVRRAFSKAEAPNVNEKECREMYEALERISNDNALKKYPLEESYRKITVSGLDYEGCHFMNSVKREEEFNKKLSTKLTNVIPSFLRRGHVAKKSS